MDQRSPARARATTSGRPGDPRDRARDMGDKLADLSNADVGLVEQLIGYLYDSEDFVAGGPNAEVAEVPGRAQVGLVFRAMFEAAASDGTDGPAEMDAR